MSENRDFKGIWIPKELWLNTELTLLEKCIFVEIDSLDNENHCTASNEYFAKFCNCSESKITKAIKKLEELEMIEILAFDGRHRKIRIVKSTRQDSKKYDAESQKVRPNNIDIKIKNNKSISKDIDYAQQFEFGFKSNTKKPSLYDKCVNVIDDFTDDSILRELLIKALRMFLDNSRESSSPFYTNTFKGKLNTLKKLADTTDSQCEIVQQTLDRGWNSFYELKRNNRKTGNAMIDIERLSGEVSERAKHKGGKIYDTF